MRRSGAPRLFVDGGLAVGAIVDLPDAVAHHAQRVLRLRIGDPITLFDGRGGEYAARLDAHARARIERFDPVERESPLALTLIQALVASDKLDWLIEKAVELGAAAIVVAPAVRSVVRLDGDRLARRRLHWRDITVAACSQCGRNRLPAVSDATTLEAALAATEAAQKFILAPASQHSLTTSANLPTAIAVGPEGGFSEAELALAERHGFLPVRAGPRVLRTETAGLAALAALQALHGDLR